MPRNGTRTVGVRLVLATVAGSATAIALAWPAPVNGQATPAGDAKHSTQHQAGVTKATEAGEPLVEQVRQLRDKVAKLEAALSKGQVVGQSSPKGRGQGMDMGTKAGDTSVDQTGRVSAKFQRCLECHRTRPSGTLPASHLEGPGDGVKGAVEGRATAGQEEPTSDNAMGKMSKGTSMGKMGMGMMGGEMSGMGMGKMSGGMGASKMGQGGQAMGDMGKMMGDEGMMGMEAMGKAKRMGMGSMKMATNLPGFPGVSRLYHIGAEGFFLNHDEHISLSPNQRKKLNQIKQKALLGGSTCGRKVEEEEQQLWELTASDEPDASAIEAKVREIAKHQGDQRLAFIRAVGEAAKVLTDDQRQSLAGTEADADATSKPAPAKP